MSIEESILKEIWSIVQKYELLGQKAGENFNIFEIASIENKEVIMCRVLGEFLNPKGKHSQGTKYLKIFVEEILGKKDFNYNNANVYLEYLIHNNRRIDIVICDDNYFIPIEVKIDAGDQANQCDDYLKYAKNTDMYYLTLTGYSPSEYSFRGTNSINGVVELSFEDDIVNWLTKCVEDISTLKIAPIREILLQLIRTIKKLTNQLGDECGMEIKELLTKSSENMKTAVLLEKSLKESKTELLIKVFKTLEEKLKAQGLKVVKNDYHYEGDRTKKFYGKYTNPGICFEFRENVKPDIDMLLRIEIDHRIFVGFMFTKSEKWETGLMERKELEKILTDKVIDSSQFWPYSEYLPNGDKGTSPNFRDLNDEYFKLYDDAYFNEFIDKSVKRIMDMYNSI